MNIPGTFEDGFTPPPLYHDGESTALLRRTWTAPQWTDVNAWTMGECRIIVAREKAGVDGEWLMHLSISCESRHPTWDEIKTARYRLLPLDRCFGMLLPPPQFYVNVPEQNHVMHIWEVTDPREPWSGM